MEGVAADRAPASQPFDRSSSLARFLKSAAHTCLLLLPPAVLVSGAQAFERPVALPSQLELRAATRDRSFAQLLVRRPDSRPAEQADRCDNRDQSGRRSARPRSNRLARSNAAIACILCAVVICCCASCSSLLSAPSVSACLLLACSHCSIVCFAASRLSLQSSVANPRLCSASAHPLKLLRSTPTLLPLSHPALDRHVSKPACYSARFDSSLGAFETKGAERRAEAAVHC